MKNIRKLLPAVASLALLVGCSTVPSLGKDTKKNPIVKNQESVTPDTYQDLYEDLYNEHGVEVAAKEMLVRVAEYVLGQASDFWTTDLINKQYEIRINETFDGFYSSYKKDGLFVEDELVSSLRGQGYKIVKKSQDGFKETVNNLVGHKHLKEFLTYDYSDYEENLKKDIKVDLLKEEYIRSQRATSTTYYSNKDVRTVSYFTYSPEDSTQRSEYARKFQAIIEADSTKSFDEMIDTLENEWKCVKLAEAARDFAIINKLAYDGIGTSYAGVNANSEYPLPEVFANAAKEAEIKYAADTKYGFKNIYAADATKVLEATEISSAKDALNTYSSNGAQSIYKGYYEKQLEIITTSYLTKEVYTSDSSDCIDSTVTDALEDWDALLNVNGVDTSYLDVNGNGSAVYKSGSTCYIINAAKIDDSSDNESKAIALRRLAQTTSNVKNAIYYYLTDLTEKKVFSVHNQEVYDYLNTTYSYGADE